MNFIFDLDGTLVDSSGDYLLTIHQLIEKFNLRSVEVDQPMVEMHLGQGLRSFVESVFATGGRPDLSFSTIESVFLEIYDQVCLSTTSIYEGLADLLHTSAIRGSSAVLTNKHEQPAKKLIGHLFERDVFTHVLGFDSLGAPKPSPAGVHKIIQDNGWDPNRTFLVGDGTPDMQCAQNAGIPAIAVAYGYTKLETLRTFHPSQVAHSPTELVGLIQGLLKAAK